MTGLRDKLAGIVALGVSGAAAYGFLAIAAHALGPIGFAPLGALWAAVFLAGASLATSLETELARRIGAARGRGADYAAEVRAGFALAMIVGAVALGLAIGLGAQLDGLLFSGERGMTLAGAVAFSGLMVGAAVRGTYAGSGQLTLWGAYLLTDGGSRFVVALVAALLLPTAMAFAIALALGPWLAVAMAAGPVRKIARGVPGRLFSGVRSLAGSSATLVVGASAASLLTYFGAVLLTGLDRGPDPGVGSYIAALTLARVPLFLLSPLIAIGLPLIAFAAAGGARRVAVRNGAGLIGIALAMGIVVVVAGVAAGPTVLALLFGHEFVISSESMLALSVASALWIIATAAAATAIAAGRAGLVAGAWCLGVVAAAIVAQVAGPHPFERTNLAIVTGAATAALGLSGVAIVALGSPRGVRSASVSEHTIDRGGASPARMRVRYVYDARYPEMNGGAERRYHELAVRLAPTCDVDYVSWTFGDDVRVQVRDGVRYRGVGQAPEFYGPDGKRRVGEAVAFAVRLIPTLLRHRVDVLDVAATPTIPLFGAWLAATITKTPLVVTWHEFWGEHWHTYLPDGRAVATIARWLESRSRRLGDRIVAVSPFTAARIGPGRWAHKVSVVGNGVVAEEIESTSPAPERIDIAYVGRLIDEKRIELLLGAVEQLAPDNPSVRCVVIGDGPERTRLEALAGSLGITANVRFTGRISTEEVNAALRAAATLVLPSAREGYGIVVVEAQAAGAIPIVTTGPATAAPSLIRDGIDGLVVDATPEAIAAAVRELIADPHRQARMRSAAAEAAHAATWDAVAADMLAVYRGVVRGRAAVPAPMATSHASGQLS
jgi:glycosyltransferase involved in cell wall biosynthesis/O-antigen/teichoic acid export membrane protein